VGRTNNAREHGVEVEVAHELLAIGEPFDHLGAKATAERRSVARRLRLNQRTCSFCTQRIAVDSAPTGLRTSTWKCVAIRQCAWTSIQLASKGPRKLREEVAHVRAAP
jgi:hypothetical protein